MTIFINTYIFISLRLLLAGQDRLFEGTDIYTSSSLRLCELISSCIVSIALNLISTMYIQYILTEFRSDVIYSNDLNILKTFLSVPYRVFSFVGLSTFLGGSLFQIVYFFLKFVLIFTSSANMIAYEYIIEVKKISCSVDHIKTFSWFSFLCDYFQLYIIALM